MGLASASLSALRIAKVEKTEVTLLLDTELTDRVKAMKVLLKDKTGCYFSLSHVCEIAIETALKQAELELRKSEQSGDEITML